MEEDDQVVVRAAWLYYMEGLTQDRVAEQLGLTRLRVNRLLGEARASGLVGITINSRLACCLQLEGDLKRICGLQDAAIVPTPQDPALIPALLGRAAGEFLSRHLETRRVQGIGVGWGATLREAIRFVKPGQWPGINVNSMMGGLTRGLEINTFETAAALAARLGARCSYLAAPLYAGSQKSRDTLVSQDVFRESFAEMAANDVALLSVGDISERSLLVRYGLPKDVTIASLKRANAVGDIVGQFLDATGKPVAHPLNKRAISPALDVLAKIPTVVVASGGPNKAAIIAAVLRAGLVKVLVCDEDTAAQALRLYAKA
ncbi:sugar-binding transcriptional regulator [Caenimonas aquaedulcis]|uniref:Sugar-binding transcriptional regulator n=1 Tax=Caenimonas aquaedulcis TaxID=2793270 RepID=A0A931H8W8_9BURK|nr:sugar-binding domain-containing protein [Caenimonas aquaedulcis]MBG9390552.1 sugar-binding transcriptional regulator [Caenimonas aquaedulcis]